MYHYRSKIILLHFQYTKLSTIDGQLVDLEDYLSPLRDDQRLQSNSLFMHSSYRVQSIWRDFKDYLDVAISDLIVYPFAARL